MRSVIATYNKQDGRGIGHQAMLARLHLLLLSHAAVLAAVWFVLFLRLVLLWWWLFLLLLFLYESFRVAIAMLLMKIVPAIPGHFTAYEWLALGIWIALGGIAHRRRTNALRS